MYGCVGTPFLWLAGGIGVMCVWWDWMYVCVDAPYVCLVMGFAVCVSGGIRRMCVWWDSPYVRLVGYVVRWGGSRSSTNPWYQRQ